MFKPKEQQFSTGLKTYVEVKGMKTIAQRLRRAKTEVMKVLPLYVKWCNTTWGYTVVQDSIKPQATTKEQNSAIANKLTKDVKQNHIILKTI